MPLPSRDLTITYGNLTLGGTSTAYYIDAPIRLAVNPDKAVVEADVIVVGAYGSDFEGKCEALETAFSTPRQYLDVKFGAAIHEEFDPADWTGFNQAPSATKVGDIDSDTGKSRRYRVAVAVDLPADTYVDHSGATTSARRNATVNLYTTDAGRRRLSVTGTYTASATDNLGAREQYAANITDYLNDLVTAFGGTWETATSPLDPQVATDDMNTICHFSVTLEELIFNQSQGVLDSTLLRRQKMLITRSADLAGDSTLAGLRAQRLNRISIDYSVAVNKAESQDLKSVWESTIKPYLTAMAKAASNTNSGFVESEVPSFDYVENRISARMTYVSVPGSNLLSARITTDESYSTGLTLMPVWSGERLKKHRFTGPGTITRTVTVVITELGTADSASVVNLSGGEFDAAGGGSTPPPGSSVADLDSQGVGVGVAGLALAGGVPEPTSSPDGGELSRAFLGSVHSTTPRKIGPVGGESLDVVDRMVVARYEYYVDASGGQSVKYDDPPVGFKIALH